MCLHARRYGAFDPSIEGYGTKHAHGTPNAETYSIEGVNTVTGTTDGVYFAWTSTHGMDGPIEHSHEHGDRDL